MSSKHSIKIENAAFYCITGAIALQRLSMAVGNILYVLGILFFLITLYKQYKAKTLHMTLENVSAKTVYKIIGISLLLIIPSVIFSYHFGPSLKAYLEIWIYRLLPVFIIPFCVKSRKKLSIMLAALFISLTIDSLIALYQDLALGDKRASGFSNNPLNLAAILSMIIPVQIIVAKELLFPQWLRRTAWATLLVSLIGLYSGQSRGSWALLFSTPFFLVKYLKNSKVFFMSIFAIILVFAGIILTNPEYQARFRSITTITTNVSNHDRVVLAESAINMTKDHLLLGVGPGNFQEFYKKQYKLPQMVQDLNHAHNNLLQVSAESGIIGGFSYIFLFGSILIMTLRAAIKGSVTGYMRFVLTAFFIAFGFIDYTFDATAIMKVYWYVMGVTLALDGLKDSTDDASESIK